MDALLDDIDAELLPLFLEEAGELYPQIGDTLQAWSNNPSDALLARKLYRNLHTLKGSARMAGAMQVGKLVHQMEALATAADTRRDDSFRDQLRSQFEQIGQMIHDLNTCIVSEHTTTPTEETFASRVPFASIAKRLYRIVRQTGKELGKRASLELRGTEAELESMVLEKMTAPFEHLLRNAVAHGLESPQQRESAGKPPVGDISLSLRVENNAAIFELVDDGAGLDFDSLRRRAMVMGLLQTGAEAKDEHLMQLIFTPGLSTATEVTAISGRGVGMDVVRSEINALGGRIAVSSARGEGTRFIIHLPLEHSSVLREQ